MPINKALQSLEELLVKFVSAAGQQANSTNCFPHRRQREDIYVFFLPEGLHKFNIVGNVFESWTVYFNSEIDGSLRRNSLESLDTLDSKKTTLSFSMSFEEISWIFPIFFSVKIPSSSRILGMLCWTKVFVWRKIVATTFKFYFSWEKILCLSTTIVHDCTQPGTERVFYTLL